MEHIVDGPKPQAVVKIADVVERVSSPAKNLKKLKRKNQKSRWNDNDAAMEAKCPRQAGWCLHGHSLSPPMVGVDGSHCNNCDGAVTQQVTSKCAICGFMLCANCRFARHGGKKGRPSGMFPASPAGCCCSSPAAPKVASEQEPVGRKAFVELAMISSGMAKHSTTPLNMVQLAQWRTCMICNVLWMLWLHSSTVGKKAVEQLTKIIIC